MTDATSLVTTGELEEARDGGMGILTDLDASREGYTRDAIIELLVSCVTIEMSGLSKKDLGKVSVHDISKAIRSARQAPMPVLRARLYKLLETKRELVMLALRMVDRKMKINKKTGDMEFVDLPPQSAFGRPVVLEEFEEM
jgi:hypothetical protein